MLRKDLVRRNVRFWPSEGGRHVAGAVGWLLESRWEVDC